MDHNYLELWLIRHGETMWNRERRMQGSSDIPLSPWGKQQAMHLATRLAASCPEPFDTVWSSDLSRARQTAELALSQVPWPTIPPIQEDTRLREIHLGSFEGTCFIDLTPEQQDAVKVFWAGPYDQRVPDGESSDDVQARAMDWLYQLPLSGRVIAFTHGGVIVNILHQIIGRPQPYSWNNEETRSWGIFMHNTSITKLLVSEQHITVAVINDTAHLENMNARPK